jgi:HK97 family phage major capsid protein
MSEEIIKNMAPSGSSTPVYPNSQGAFVTTGDITSPGYGTVSEHGIYMGTAPDGSAAQASNFGLTTGINAVNPSRTASPTYTGNGILRPEQARRFIDYVWDATTLANDGRRVTMRANTMELEKINLGDRVIAAATQGKSEYTNVGATFSKVELTTKKLRLDWEVSAESLEDNIEGAALEDHLVRLMTNAFGNDIEDLAINGLGSGGTTFENIMTGFIKQLRTTPSNAQGVNKGSAHEVVNASFPSGSTAAFTDWTTEKMQQIILAMPRRYRAITNGLKFYAGTDTFANIVKNNGTYINNIGSTEAARGQYWSGESQTFGGARQTRVLGIPVLEVPYYPAGFVDLTFPQNRIWGFQRDITVNRFYVPKKDTVEYTVFVRFGIAWEELDAVSFADAELDS